MVKEKSKGYLFKKFINIAGTKRHLEVRSIAPNGLLILIDK
jgi:hypothetical protein